MHPFPSLHEIASAEGTAVCLFESMLTKSQYVPETSYRVGPFTVDILRHKTRTIYTPRLILGSTKDIEILRAALEVIERSHFVPHKFPRSLGDFITMVQKKAAPLLCGCYQDPLLASRIVAYEYIGLTRLMPIFEDHLVDELFVDDPLMPPYLEHRTHGRCDLGYSLTERELESIRTHAEVYGGISPSYRTPSIKTELHLGGVKLRVGMDTYPVAYTGFSLHIRKVGGNALTLTALARGGDVPIEASSLLLACLQNRLNVTIIGPSGSGKTTLLNALDMSIDPRLRRVYVEDAVESIDLAAWGFRQLKLRVPSIETGYDEGQNKLKEVLKTLHRSPDILILGEVQDASHSSAMFQAAEAGITGIQTFHSYSPEQSIRRWTSTHGIQKEQLADLGVLATMVRASPFSPRRQLVRISAILPSIQLIDVYRSEQGVVFDNLTRLEQERGLASSSLHTSTEAFSKWLDRALVKGYFDQTDFLEYAVSERPVTD